MSAVEYTYLHRILVLQLHAKYIVIILFIIYNGNYQGEIGLLSALHFCLTALYNCLQTVSICFPIRITGNGRKSESVIGTEPINHS